MLCKRCAKENPELITVCSYCGEPLGDAPEQTVKPSDQEAVPSGEAGAASMDFEATTAYVDSPGIGSAFEATAAYAPVPSVSPTAEPSFFGLLLVWQWAVVLVLAVLMTVVILVGFVLHQQEVSKNKYIAGSVMYLRNEICDVCEVTVGFETPISLQGGHGLCVQYLRDGETVYEREVADGATFVPSAPVAWDALRLAIIEQKSGDILASTPEQLREKTCTARSKLEAIDLGAHYSLEKYIYDIEQRFPLYGDILKTETVSSTLRGNRIYKVTLGRGERKLFVCAGVHARENANTPMLMKAIEALAVSWYAGDERVRELLDQVTFVMLPLVNPDGYELSYLASNGDIKTNAAGVNVNRNFPFSYWISGDKLGNYFGGYTPGSEKETQAVMSVLESEPFRFALDIHSRGRLIYATKSGIYYENMLSDADPGALNNAILSYARVMQELTGFVMEAETRIEMGEEATVTDYAFSLGIPCATIETMPGTLDLPAQPTIIQQEYALLHLPELLLRLGELSL